MIKAEMYDLGRYNGMAEPDPDGSYHGLEIRTAATTQTFLIPEHQLPTDWRVAYLRDALKQIETSTDSRDQGKVAMVALAATDGDGA